MPSLANLHVISGADARPAHPDIRKIGIADIKEALRKGIDDFSAMPSHAIFLCLIYPIIGFILGRMVFGYAVLPLLFPIMAGFALIGPFAAIGLYELSRRREMGLDVYWTHAFDVLRSPSIAAIAALGILLMVIFLAWLASAQIIYQSLFDNAPPESIVAFTRQILSTSAGWTLILLGNGIGFIFAVLVLTLSVVSFPLLLDRDVGAAVAVLTSVRAVIANPFAMGLWGLIVVVALAIGSLPIFLGLTVVMPVLGHSTWHLYRKVVAPPYPGHPASPCSDVP